MSDEAVASLRFELEKQVRLNAILDQRLTALVAEMRVLSRISDAVLKNRDVNLVLDEVLALSFEAGGVVKGALYTLDERDQLIVRSLGDAQASWDPADLSTLFGQEQFLRNTIASGEVTAVPSVLLRENLGGGEQSEVAGVIVPLVYGGMTLGGLLLVSHERSLDSTAFCSFARNVGNQIMQALALALAFSRKTSAELAASNQNALLQALFENAPDFIVRLDVSGTVRYANKMLPGLREEQVIGVSWLAFLPEDQREIARRAFAQVLESGEPVGYEIQGYGADGALRWYSSRLGPVRIGGKIGGFVLIARDITEKKQAEAHLFAADRLASAGTLAAGVAHEINNPLSSVMANLEFAIEDVTELAKTTPLPPQLQAELTDALAAASRVQQIVGDIKVFSRDDRKESNPVDIQALLESTLRVAGAEIRQRATLIKEFSNIPPVMANISQLGQVFMNLIVNAVQAIPEEKAGDHQIRVSTRLDSQKQVVVSIADSGAGMSTEVQSRLFTPFFTTKAVGAGLGLSICHRIVTSLGGQIAVHSELGKGTEVQVVLPSTWQATLSKPALVAWGNKTARARGRVLVIDDDELIGGAVKRALSQEHDVTVLVVPEQALRLLAEDEKFDVILCDLMMPRISGMELFERMKRNNSNLARRFVFLTGGAFTSGAKKFLASVANPRLDKPFDLPALRALVRSMVAR